MSLKTLHRVGDRLLLSVLIAALPATSIAMDLIEGSLIDERSNEVVFKLTAEARDRLIGGIISLDERHYRILGESRHGLIGASRLEDTKLAEDNRVGEYLVFSSSYSEQTATGNPWVQSDRYVGCDAPYNSFLALYRVLGQARITALGSKPFGALTEVNERADDASVYCFMTRRAH